MNKPVELEDDGSVARGLLFGLPVSGLLWWALLSAWGLL